MAPKVKCRICLSQKISKRADYYCNQCKSHMCESCENKHQEKPSLRNHRVKPFALIMDRRFTCEDHKEEGATAWCCTCGGAICASCNLVNHYKHTTRDLSDYLADWVGDIKSLDQNINPMKNDIFFNKTSIDSRITQLQNYLVKTETAIREHCEAIRNEIDTKENEIISKLSETIQSRVENLQNDRQIETDKIQKIRTWQMMKNKALSGREQHGLGNLINQAKVLVASKPEDVVTGDVLKFLPEDSLEVGRLEAYKLPVSETSITEKGAADVCFTSPTTLLVAHGSSDGASLYETHRDAITLQYQRQILQDHLVMHIALHKYAFYVTCDHGQCKTVHRCDITTHQLTPDGQWPVKLFSKPCGIAVMDSGQVVVSDVDRKEVSIHRSNGDRLATIGGQAVGSNINTNIKFTSPLHLATYNNQVYVSDCGQQTVFVLDLQGQLLHNIGSKGNKDGEINNPRAMCFTDSGNLLIADRLNNRISQFDSTGTFMSHVITDQIADISNPWFISFLKRGNMRFLCVLVSNGKQTVVKVFNI